ncbi:restriction endonuclease [Vibrio harveyi]|uniref:restriction endonuclease n=1 Tax=Vibrio harveyi TaxID=669 RepID=UPI0023802FBD|nr:restriction endonuclease [Vibrio harveyi]
MKKSPTDIIDFTEIGSDSKFEKFVEHFLEDEGYRIDRPPAYGQDRKRDLIVSDAVRGSKRGFRWLVSCKYYSGRVGQDDDKADANKLVEHDCDGFMFVYSSEPTNSLVDSVEAVCERVNKPYLFISGWDIEKSLISEPKYGSTFRSHLPNSFKRIMELKEEPKCQCKFHTVYAAGEPLYVLSLQKRKYDIPVYEMICDECLYDLRYSLDDDYYSWRAVTLIDEYW